MPKLILVRHGQASFGAADYDRLSAHGERQAELVAAELGRRGDRVVRLVAGSLRRQQSTAAPIAAALGVEVETDARWNEYDSADVLTAHSSTDARLAGGAGGISSRDFQSILEDGLTAWQAAGNDSAATESWPAFRARVGDALEDTLGALGSGETAVVSTSGGSIAAVCATVLGADLPVFLGLNRTVVNAAITTVLTGRSGTSLLSFNDHAHLLGGEAGLVTFR